MSREIGMRMKVIRNTGKVSEFITEDAVPSLEVENDEFQHLIILPKNPLKGKCFRLLRVTFFTLVIIAAVSVFSVIVRDHYNTPESAFEAFRQRPPISFGSIRNSTNSSDATAVCYLQDEWKFDCFPEENADEKSCLARGCCWSPIQPQTGGPWCYYPVGFSYYTWTNFTTTKFGLQGNAQQIRNSPYHSDVKQLEINVIFETENIVRVKIFDPNVHRFEVPLGYKTYTTKPESQNYTVDVQREGFQIRKKGVVFPIFDSTVAPMLYADQFLSISTRLMSDNIYGIGEVVDSLRRNTSWNRYVLWNADKMPVKNQNLYGSHPFYMILDNDGNSHGVFLANSNAMEIVLQPAPALTFRTIGGILDLRFFLGPTPADVMDQYTDIIGRPMLPPYWSLGFHLCRFNYKTLAHTKEILQNNIKAGIPVDVQWNDLDYMKNRNDFTVDNSTFGGIHDFILDLHQQGMHYIPIIDPGISGAEGKGKYPPYDDGIEMDIFVKDINGNIFVGRVWNPKSTVWPDFSHPNASHYWMSQIENFRKIAPIDAAWIDMNEPSNFLDGTKTGCPLQSKLDYPPYVPRVGGKKLFTKTICPSARQYGGRHYDMHNLYGTQETIVTFKALGDLTGERPFVISRSTFPGQGRYGGHWTGDVASTYEDMRQSIPQILSFGLFGIPMVGADLCLRWSQLGAYTPFARNHNTDNGIPQDPYSMGTEVIEASKETLNVRYSLLPYIYSTFFRAHLSGQPVARPLFFEFPTDAKTFAIDNQFMLGPSVMIVPILEENYSKSTIKAYLPNGWWYQHYYPNEILESLGGEEKHLKIPEHGIPILYRGGTVVVKQIPKQTTTESRKQKFYIEVYLSVDNTAEGELFWDDGVSNLPDKLGQYNQYQFKAAKNELTMTTLHSGYDSKSMTLGKIEIFGVVGPISSVNFNNVNFNFSYGNQTLTLDGLELSGTSWTDSFFMQWK